MILVDVSVFPEYFQVTRSNIGPKSVEKCRDVQNEPISDNFRKKAKGSLRPVFSNTAIFS
jgi:hypothetical protein